MIASTTSRPNHDIPTPVLVGVLSPLAAATAAPAQSPWRSAGSMSLRRMSSACVDVPPVTAFGTSKATARSSVAIASSASSSPKSLALIVFCAQLYAPWPEKSLTYTTQSWIRLSLYSLSTAA